MLFDCVVVAVPFDFVDFAVAPVDYVHYLVAVPADLVDCVDMLVDLMFDFPFSVHGCFWLALCFFLGAVKYGKVTCTDISL